MKDKSKLIGQVYNDWTVLEILPNRKLKCRCSCGKIKDVAEYSVISGKSTNCGHRRYGDDITGLVFGELTILGKSTESCKWNCICSCGRELSVTKYDLQHGKDKCGPKHDGSIIGEHHNNLTVESFNKQTKLWICRCSCGNTREVSLRDLRSGNITKCEQCANVRKTIVKENKKSDSTPTVNIRKHELIGKTFGDLHVIGYNHSTYKLVCRCSCGNMKEVKAYDLVNHRVSSCGHNSKKPKQDLSGKVFGELTVLEYLTKGKWKCKCSCGNITTASGAALINHSKLSCGHLKVVDLRGKIFGELTVIDRDPNDSSKWICKCSCGNTISLPTGALRFNGYKSCGHIKRNKFVNILGQQFGELTVVEYLGYQNWKCKCSCGTVVEVLGHNLRSGHTKSCGCKSLELYNNTMLDRYGDTSSKRIDNPREDWQIEILESKDSFIQYVLKYEQVNNSKPSAFELAKPLNVTPATIINYATKYNILLRNAVSSFEDEIGDIFTNFKRHNRSVLKNLELDFYDEERKIAIEFNGNYWHSSLFKDKLYHQNKTIECAKHGIRLIHIFEYEWQNAGTREKLINLITAALEEDEPNIIFGRHTKILEIDNREASAFLTNYHLQGDAISSIRIGCYYNNELLGVMTFGKPRFSSEEEWELVRMAWKPGYVIIGGTEKLFKYFVNKHKPNSIISYCDISKFNGDSYIRLGFKTSQESITTPNYVWVHKGNSNVLTRYETQKHKLVAKHPDYFNMTEDEIMTTLGYVKIYNSGNLKFVWNKN